MSTARLSGSTADCCNPLYLLTAFFPALVSGLLLTLSFPGIHLDYLGFIALCPLIISLNTMTLRQAFAAGLTAGLTHFCTLIYWIVPTLNNYGGLHFLLSASALILLCLYLSLYPALFGFLLNKLSPPPVLLPLVGGCLWTGLEWVRTHLFTGFPWGVLGYSQYGNRLLVQVADITGVLGISFLLVLCNGFLAVVWLWMTAVRKQHHHLPVSRIFICLGYTAILLASAYGYGMVRITGVEQIMERSQAPRIAIVQGNIRQDMKWSDAFRRATIEKYGVLSLEAAGSDPGLIIWPETALPFYYGHDLALSNQVDQYIRRVRTHFLIGSPAVQSNDEITRYFNRVVMLNPLAIPVGSYDKTHLVPFGEYIPFQELLFFIEKLTTEAGNFSKGPPAFLPLAFNRHRTGVVICFEILFPDISRQFVKNGADLLITVTNDAWFGRTSAAAQHFSFAVLRAVENRRSVARAANTGISGFIDPMGQIFKPTALFSDAVITRDLPAVTELSVYTRYGDFFPCICVIAMGIGFVIKTYQNFKRRHHLWIPI